MVFEVVGLGMRIGLEREIPSNADLLRYLSNDNVVRVVASL